MASTHAHCCSRSNMLYSTGGQGLLRYCFLCGSHEKTLPSSQVTVEANVVVLSQQGHLIFGSADEDCTARYRFVDGVCTHVNEQDDRFIPASQLVETLLKNVGLSTLILAEVPIDQCEICPYIHDRFVYVAIMVTGRSDLGLCQTNDRFYLSQMLRIFVPRFVQSMSPKSSDYLPGDARNLCRELAERMDDVRDDPELSGFLQLYHRRYLRRPGMEQKEILELCLLHILKMPFELTSSVRQGLVSY